MCGIAGYFQFSTKKSFDPRLLLNQMGEVQAHRGPDDSGIWFDDICGLSFRRLAIIDLVSGKQPMSTQCGQFHLVFNGEIYNFLELKAQLETVGAVFRTASDSEVILIGYVYWGEEIVNRLRGMFAFAIYDKQSQTIFAARDHTGIKPFYYYEKNNNLVFGSEPKVLLKHPDVNAVLNELTLPKYLSFLWVPPPETLYQEIKTLPPGHCMSFGRSGSNIRRYWHPVLTEVDTRMSHEQWIEEIDRLLFRSVSEQMMSDVPLGAFLSGGVDSSLIIHYMNAVKEDAISTYTTGFSRKDLENDVIRSDIEFARLAAKKLNVEYNELMLEPKVVDLLPKLTRYMDAPVADPAAITTYLICQASKKSATVMLSGVGGDEVFGGYPRYSAVMLGEYYTKLPQCLTSNVIEPLIRALNAGSSRVLRDAQKFIKSANLDFKNRYFGYLTYYNKSELQTLLCEDFCRADIFEYHERIFAEYSSTEQLQTLLNLDLMTFLPQLNLAYTDKMSSANSVEVRVPFLDHELIEAISRMPANKKIKGTTSKFLLKKLAQRCLPKEVVWRKKAGFGAPIGAWLKGQTKEMMFDLLSEETIRKRGYFNQRMIRQMINDHLSGKLYNSNQLWQLMAFELFLQECID